MLNSKNLIRFISWVLALVILFSLNSCFEKKTKKETKTGSESFLVPEDGGTLVLTASSDINELNPLTYSTANDADVIGQIFGALVERDKDINIIPSLAESWEFSPDFLAITYHLRKGLLWSDGTPLTSADVEYSYKMYVHPDIKFKGISTFELISGVEVIDKNTIKFKFKEVYADELANSGITIMPKHILEKIPPKGMKGSSFSSNPIGSGPFKLEKWDRGQQWSLIPNELYYKGRPHLDRVIWRHIPDEMTRLAGLKMNEVDVVENISAQYYEEMKNQQNINLVQMPQRGYTYIGWNLRNPLFQSKKVRQALAMALNKEEIINKYLFGLGEVAVSPILKAHWAFNKNIKPFPYNLEKAKQMLAEEGWTDTDGDGWLDKNGKKFSFTVKTNIDQKVRANVAVYMQTQYKQIGIECNPHLMEWNALVEDEYKRNFDCYIGAWQLSFTVNPKSIFHSSEADKEYSNNDVSYKNAVVDSLIDIGRRTLDEKKAKVIWDKFQNILYDDQPYCFLYIITYIHGINKRVKGVDADIRGLYHNLDEWWIPIAERKKGEM